MRFVLGSKNYNIPVVRRGITIVHLAPSSCIIYYDTHFVEVCNKQRRYMTEYRSKHFKTQRIV